MFVVSHGFNQYTASFKVVWTNSCAMVNGPYPSIQSQNLSQ